MREELGWVGEEGLHGEVEGSEVGVHFVPLLVLPPFYGVLYS